MGGLGIIAGCGPLPFIVAREARAQGRRVVAVGLREETDPALAGSVDAIHWIGVGQLGGLIRALKRERVAEAVMVGKVHLTHLFSRVRPDLKGALLFLKVPDLRGDTLLEAIADELARQGIRLLDCSAYLGPVLTRPGVLTRRAPSPQEQADIAFGREMARAIAALRIGQTVVVRQRTVVAVESVEGTDAAIRRGGELANGGVVVVKVSRPGQDMRFDLPTVGPETLRALREARATALALDAGRSLLLEREAVLAEADAAGITIVAD